MKEYGEKKVHINWNTVINHVKPMSRQIYENKRIEGAFDIIGKSFVYGAKLKRNPISDAERQKQFNKEKEEE